MSKLNTSTIIFIFGKFFQTQGERDELYNKFVKAIHEVQQKSNFKNLLLEKKLGALADTLEKKVWPNVSLILTGIVIQTSYTPPPPPTNSCPHFSFSQGQSFR